MAQCVPPPTTITTGKGADGAVDTTPQANRRCCPIHDCGKASGDGGPAYSPAFRCRLSLRNTRRVTPVSRNRETLCSLTSELLYGKQPPAAETSVCSSESGRSLLMACYQTNPKPGRLGRMENRRSRGQPSAFHGPRLRPAKSDRQPPVGHRHLVLRNKAKLG